MSRLRAFLAELQRRRVWHVAVVYGAVAFAVVEAADLFFPRLALPDWTVTLVAVLALLGFPIALVLAWALEIGPEGVRRTRSTDDPARSPPPGRPTRAIATALAVAVIGAGGVALWLRAGTARDGADEIDASPRADSLVGGSIAVLPFENLGPPDEAYFAAGMTDEITSRLAAVNGLSVISRLSALRYVDTEKSTGQIGAELGVSFILGGSVRWGAGEDGRVRITPELVRASDGAVLWSQRYDRVIEDIFEVQSEIAGEVIDRLGVTLLQRERASLASRPTENLEAYSLYLKGRHFWNGRTDENIQIALDYFQRAVALDPGYARAHVGIADVWIFRGWYSSLAPHDAFPPARRAVLAALEIDESLAEAHASLAHIHLEYDHDWEAAEREYLRAIELDPRYAIAHHWYGGYLSAMGRHAEALAEAERARELEPLSLIINTWVGLRHYFAGRYDAAIAEYGTALELDPDFVPAHWHLGWALEEAGRYEEAITEAEKAVALSRGKTLYLASLGHAYAVAGRHGEAREILQRLVRESETTHVSAYHVAVIHGALGDGREALAWLELAFEERSPWIGYLAVDPRVAPLRSDPAFTALLERARLPH